MLQVHDYLLNLQLQEYIRKSLVINGTCTVMPNDWSMCVIFAFSEADWLNNLDNLVAEDSLSWFSSRRVHKYWLMLVSLCSSHLCYEKKRWASTKNSQFHSNEYPFFCSLLLLAVNVRIPFFLALLSKFQTKFLPIIQRQTILGHTCRIHFPPCRHCV